MLILTDYVKLKALDHVFQGYLVSGLSARLFQNDIVPDSTSGWLDFVEADFSGYAPVSLTYGAAAINPDTGKGETIPNDAVFSHDGGATANFIYGWYIIGGTDGEGDHLWAAERFDPTPKTFASAGDTLTITQVIRDYQI